MVLWNLQGGSDACVGACKLINQTIDVITRKHTPFIMNSFIKHKTEIDVLLEP